MTYGNNYMYNFYNSCGNSVYIGVLSILHRRFKWGGLIFLLTFTYGCATVCSKTTETPVCALRENVVQCYQAKRCE